MYRPASSKPVSEAFGGFLHDLKRPLRERRKLRQFFSPYIVRPTSPSDKAFGFYMASKGFAMGDAPCDLRIEEAGENGRRGATGYYADEFGDTIMTPIIARLPHGRGFLAGWTMGAGMCAVLERDIAPDEDTARRWAHSIAEDAADRERERLDAEEAADAACKLQLIPFATRADIMARSGDAPSVLV